FQAPNEYHEFYKLGLGEPIPLSAAQGLNTGDLMDAIVKNMPELPDEPEDVDSIKIAFIGRPNVGKSSLVNKILGEERVIVSDIPGTTRDAIDTMIQREGNSYILIDTAGIRRKTKIDIATERYSVMRALRAVDRCDVALLVVDAEAGITEQDKKIAGYAHDQGKASVIIINKWDLLKKDDKTFNNYVKDIREELGYMKYAPVLFVSALSGQRVDKILLAVESVAQSHSLRVSTPGLNNLIQDAVQQNPPPTFKTKRLKIYYAAQNGIKPPKFTLFVNNAGLVHFSYLRYLEKQIRAAYGFEGTPIKLVMKTKGGSEDS
ncbi:MAG: ribosome biogenesis GTPase Der, partial [Peptococcaceae bacterium]|nr:ribosome biogenesis GTPase Der [Peptococcaceae bacterium]